MDDFGVLTEWFGLKPQGKSAPMAASKGSNHAQPRNFAAPNPKPSSYTSNSTYASNSHSFNDHNSSYDVDIFGGFQSNSKQTRSSNASGFHFDYDSVFSNTKNSSVKSTFDDDIFGGFNGSASSTTNNDDMFGSFHSSSSSSTSKTQKSVAVDDLLGNFGGIKLKSPTQNGSAGFDDLIPGFGSSSSSAKGENVRRATSSCILAEDPFVVLEQTSTMTKLFTDPLEEITKVNHSGKMDAAGSSIGSSPLKPSPKPGQVLKAVKKSDVSPIDELEDFAMGRSRSNANRSSDGRHASKAKESPSEKDIKYKEAEDAAWKSQQNADDLELFFSMGSRSSSVPKSRPAVLDPLHDARINGRGKPEFPLKKTSVTTNVMGDLSSIFGDATLFEEFEEVKGESDERRRARWDRYQRTRNRMVKRNLWMNQIGTEKGYKDEKIPDKEITSTALEKAVADMNQRDRETLHEQEERLRISDRMDIQIKRWAAGKEGNMRALLSSLQYVLWPECDWEPVSLTDLITSSSVKKVYRQATLCVHPDKVQQKGATIEQKYTAEKVFDILKEAWNKFSKEELS